MAGARRDVGKHSGHERSEGFGNSFRDSQRSVAFALADWHFQRLL
jgi:hypothetical protein